MEFKTAVFNVSGDQVTWRGNKNAEPRTGEGLRDSLDPLGPLDSLDPLDPLDPLDSL